MVFERGKQEVAYLELNKSGHHDLSIVRVQQVGELASAFAESSENECAIGDTLRAGGSHADWVLGGNTGDDLAGLAQSLGNNLVLDASRLLFISLSDPLEQHDPLFGTAVLFVDFHDIEKLFNGEELGCGDSFDTGVVDGDGEIVGLDAARQPTNTNLTKDTQLTGNLRLEHHTNAYALSMKNGRSKNSLDSMADTVSKVDEIAKTGLTLIDGDDVRLD